MVKRIRKEAFPLLADNMTYDNITKESSDIIRINNGIDLDHKQDGINSLRESKVKFFSLALDQPVRQSMSTRSLIQQEFHETTKTKHYMVLPFCSRLQLSFQVFLSVWFPECPPGLTCNCSMTPDSHKLFLTM